MTEKLRAARVPAPGSIVQAELEERGWTQRDLAEIMGRPAQAINEIIRGNKRITPETAVELGKAFGTSAELWMNLETNYRLHLAQKQAPKDNIERKSRLYSLAPVAELIRRGWIEAGESLDDLEQEVCKFLGLSSLDDDVKLSVAFRHTRDLGPETSALNAWVKRAEYLARQQHVAPFDRARLAASIPSLLAYAERAEDVAQVPSALSDLGIHMVFVPHLFKSYVDGAAFELDDGRPVIALSLRYDRIDSFWFTLTHELAHIVRGHSGVDVFNQDDQDGDATEGEANELASNWLVDREEFEAFVAETKPYFSKTKVEAFAAHLHRHPGIIVGRLHHMGDLPYSHLRMLCEKVSPYLQARIDTPSPAEMTRSE
ncbi:MAG: HigA family addiction module antitoxin [Anaerolineae bacterium]